MKKTGSIFDRKIIIIVLALVLLFLIGLLIFLALTDKNKETSKVNSVPAITKVKLLEDMRLSGRSIYINPKIILEKDTEIVEYVGIINTGLTEKIFGVKIGFINKQNLDGTGPKVIRKDEVSFFYSDEVGKRLSPTAGDVIPVVISTKDYTAGNYWYIVNVVACSELSPTPNCESYASQVFEVQIQ